MTYKPIPAGACKVKVLLWSCGDDCCCKQFSIYVYFPYTHPNATAYAKSKQGTWGYKLWEGKFTSDPDYDDVDELREELVEACKHYEIPLIGIENNFIWDWEGECDIKNEQRKEV
jgi:hypothetical protein